MKKLIMTALCMMCTLACNAVPAAQNAEQYQRLEQFVTQIQALHNTRNMDDIKRYYRFYTAAGAKFHIDSVAVDEADIKKKLASEALDMDLEQYLKYIAEVVLQPGYYRFESRIKDYQYDNQNYFVNLEVTSKEFKKQTATPSVIAECAYTLESKNGAFYIAALSCAETIVIQKLK